MRKQIKRMLYFALVLALLGGCKKPDRSREELPSGPNAAEDTDIPEEPEETEPSGGEEAGGQTATLYIGTRAGGFSEYSFAYEGSLTPELLIRGIEELTGWNLTLADTVYTGKGGMSVCLSGESSLFTGPPDPQKDEFHVFDAEQLSEMILDSIQKTLQEGFTGEGGNPDALDIYYFMEGEQPLELPDLNLKWPLDQPYSWSGAERGE